MLDFIKKFLGPIEGSIKDKLHILEVWRASILGMFSGSFVWVLFSFLYNIVSAFVTDPSFLPHIRTIIDFLADKNYEAVAVAVITFLLDLWRRKRLHGIEIK